MQQTHKSYSVSRLPFKTPFFYGWIMVVIAGIMQFFTGPGQTYSVAIFIDSYIAEFDWSRSFVSSLYSMGTLVAGLVLSQIGRLVDQVGHRQIARIITLAFGAICLWMSVVYAPWMLFMGFLLIRLLGQGSLSLTAATLLPQWFITRRGQALSLMALGGVLGAAIIPPLNTFVIQAYGWRMGWVMWSLLLWAIMFPLASLLIRNRPEDVGLWPDNQPPLPESHSSYRINPAAREVSWTLGEAMRNRAFWLLIFCGTIPAAVGTAIIFHSVSLLGTKGLSPVDAALVLSTRALVQLPLNLLAGYVADRVKSHYLVAATLTGQILLLVMLIYISNLPQALFYAVVWGAVAAFSEINNGVIWPNYFGREHLGSIRGAAMTAMVIGTAFGPLPFGFAYDRLGGYNEIMVLSMVYAAVGVVAALMAPKPVKPGA